MMSSENNDTRSRILEASWKLLEASQGQGVRMSDIAKEAGISRQAVYLHFSTRAELLIATTRYLDEVMGVDDRLIPSRTASSGVERLNAFIDVWGNYIPEIYGVSKALLATKDTDPAAAEAWDDRMQAVREGCAAVIAALAADAQLSPDFEPDQATDMLWTLLTVRNWEHFKFDCGWSQQTYLKNIKILAHSTLVLCPA